MKLDVQLFATLRDRAGARTVSIDLPDGATVAQLIDRLATAHPGLAPALPSAVVAVNQEFAFPPMRLGAGDEVALFPPVSGGASFPERFAITEDRLDLNAIVADIMLPTTGAVCVFTGAVRGQSDERKTVRLDYEAYTPMVEAKMRQVAQEIRARWPKIEGVSIVQRVGRLHVGEFTVLIAVSAGHRYDGVFEAAHYGIDRLKEIVPIWKKEVGPRGEEWVEGHYRPTPADVEDRLVYEP